MSLIVVHWCHCY